jgi:phage terminase large subunit
VTGIIEGFDFRNPDYPAIFALRARNLKKLRDNPESIPSLLAYYKLNPAQMITDWGCTFDPRNAERNLPPIIPFILFPRQIEWVEWMVRHWKAQRPGPTVKSRDMGLSWLSVAAAACLCITHDDIVIGFGSRKEEYVDKLGSPKSLFHKARMFTSLLPPELRGGYVMGTTDPHMRIKFPSTGAVMVGEAGDGIGRGDRASIYFVDESAFLERPQLVEASLSQTTNCRIDISTPNGLANPFAERVLSGKFDTFRFHWRDDPRKDDAWYQKQRDELDPVTIAQEIDIDFSASIDGVLIPSAWVQSAIDSHIKLNFDPYGEKLTALDVADLGKDKNAQSMRNGILLVDAMEWHGSTVDDIYGTTQKAFDNCDEWECYTLRYDSDGVGAGVRGDARVINESRKGAIIETIAFHGGSSVLDPKLEIVKGRTNADFFENFKAQSWWMLRNRFKLTHEAVTQGKAFNSSDLISISSKCNNLTRIQTELSQPTYKKSGKGKIMINKAPDGTKSPNIADSINMVYSPSKEVRAKAVKMRF